MFLSVEHTPTELGRLIMMKSHEELSERDTVELGGLKSGERSEKWYWRHRSARV